MASSGGVVESEVDGARLIEVAGDLDVSNASPFVELLLGAADGPNARIVLDLGGADFIDSTVLNALFTARRRLQSNGGRLAIVCTKDHLYRVLEAAGIDGSFPIAGSREEALAALG
jgi:anti-anti-sigma factor